MKRNYVSILCAMTLAASMTMLGGCGQKEETGEAETPVLATEETTDASETADIEENAGNEMEKPEAAFDMDPAYQTIVDDYKTMIEEQWDAETIAAKGYSTMVADFYENDAMNQIGYMFYDLDGDLKPELLIGEMHQEDQVNRVILDAYTLKDGQPVQLFESEARNRYYLIEDDAGAVIIANEASNSAASSGYFYYTVSKGELGVQQAVVYDAEKDAENPWFMTYNDDWDLTDAESIDEATAQSIIDANTEDYADLNWIPFTAE